MTTRVITLWRVQVMSLTTFVSTMRFLNDIMLILKAIKCHLNCHMIDRILHSWSFHIKYMKLAEEARFINFIWNDHSCKIFCVSALIK